MREGEREGYRGEAFFLASVRGVEEVEYERTWGGMG